MIYKAQHKSTGEFQTMRYKPLTQKTKDWTIPIPQKPIKKFRKGVQFLYH
jgi:hypothetical protein